MKLRVLEVMNDALGLVKKSDLSGATALIRKALSGEPAEESESESKATPSVGEGHPAPPCAVRWAKPCALCAPGRRAPARPPRPPEAEPDLGERFLRRTYSGAAGSLDYRLYVPAAHEGRDLALVLMLHGCGQDPEDFALGTQMNAVAEEFGLVVAYPRQTRRANPSTCWNWFDRRHQSRGSGEPAKLAGLAQALAKEFGIPQGARVRRRAIGGRRDGGDSSPRPTPTCSTQSGSIPACPISRPQTCRPPSPR